MTVKQATVEHDFGEATVTSKGQITVPNDLRKALDISPGDRLRFVRTKDGSVRLEARKRRRHRRFRARQCFPRRRSGPRSRQDDRRSDHDRDGGTRAKKPWRMIGLDTNVLLRLFVEDDPAQSDRARRFVDAAAADEPCIVNPVVLAEFAWTLAPKL